MSEDTTTPARELDMRLRTVALEAAREAAALHRSAGGRLDPSQWDEKGTSDFVTEVDREAERRILERIRDAFPAHRVVAEEETSSRAPGETAGGEDGRETGQADGAQRGRADGTQTEPSDGAGSGAGSSSDILWIIDPLDGTTNWLHGYPEYAVSIAALDGRGLRVGVVINSATGEEFAAVRGAGAERDGLPVHVSGVTELRLALLGTGFPFKRPELIPGYLHVLGRMLETTSGVRRAGAAALDLCDVACGRLDGFWEHSLMSWDVAAGALIVMEAGGTFAALPGGSDPPLAEAARGGETICAAFAGRERYGSVHCGAFMAGNGAVDGPLVELLATELARPLNAS